MYYVYLIKSKKTNHIYIGFTNDLKRRLAEHNSNLNTSTRGKSPWFVAYCEVFKSKADAQKRELNLKKYGSALQGLKKRIAISLED
jgi:putative endonuclease